MAVAVDGRPARTRYEMVARWDAPALSALWCTLETGRTHQIRVHLAAIGHPVVADPTYGHGPELGVDRPFLHAAELVFAHPVSGEEVRATAPLPADLVAALESLGPPADGAVAVPRR